MIEVIAVECCVTCEREMYGEKFCRYCAYDDLGEKYGQALTELADAQERVAYLERTDAEQVGEFNAGYEAGERGDPPNEPPGTEHDEWRVGYAFARYPALLERIRQLEQQP